MLLVGGVQRDGFGLDQDVVGAQFGDWDFDHGGLARREDVDGFHGGGAWKLGSG